MSKIAIIQEGTQQANEPTEAAYLYHDQPFAARRAFADWFADKYWIATAEYSLKCPWETIEPYETEIADVGDGSFPDMTASSWERSAYLMMHAESAKWLACDELIILAEKPYLTLLGRALDHVSDTELGGGVSVSTPWEELETERERVAWIDQELTESGAFE